MTRRFSLAILTLALLPALVFVPGCSSKDDDDPPIVVDVIADRIANGGGPLGGAHAGTVTIVVFDEQDGSRIADVTVILDDGTSSTTDTTDTNGVVTFTGVATGPYDATMAKTGFEVLSVFGFQAATLVMPLASPRIRVDGTVIGWSSTTPAFSIEFGTLEEDLFNAWNESPLYGEVIKLPTSGDPTYTVQIYKNKVDTLTFTERDPANNNKIVNRKILPIGPYTADQTGVDVTFDGTTGLHEITGNILNLQNFVTASVDVSFYDHAARRRYQNYDVQGTGQSRTYSVQLPPNRVLTLVLTARIFGHAALGVPQEVQTFTVTTGAADNATPANVDLPFDLVSITGDFNNPGTVTGVIMALRYLGQNTGWIAGTATNYSIRVPRGVPMLLTLMGYDGS
ncbi:MAG: hypothetical protein ACYTFG_19910, partial [Planctomycetota bacterium]